MLFVEALHGGAKRTLEIVRNLRKSAPDAEIVAGNAATYDAAKALIEAGASDVKVGVGPGSVGTTSVNRSRCFLRHAWKPSGRDR